MMVLTSSVPAHCRAALGHLGLMPYFEEILFAHDLKIEKKDPEIFRVAARRMGVEPVECVVYDDSVEACRGAKAGRDAHGGGLRSVLSRLVGGDDTGVRSDHPELHGAAGGLKKRNCRKKKQGRDSGCCPLPLWPYGR